MHRREGTRRGEAALRVGGREINVWVVASPPQPCRRGEARAKWAAEVEDAAWVEWCGKGLQECKQIGNSAAEIPERTTE